MTDETRAIDEVEAQLLVDTLTRLANNNGVPYMAGTGYIQSTLTQCGVQAIFDMIRQKNIVGEPEMKRYLADAYRKQRDNLQQRGMIVAPPAQVNGAKFKL